MRDVIEDEEAGDGDQVLIVLKHCNENLSTHEKELLKLQSKIDQMEKANFDPKHWTMQGEVTATKRPKNTESLRLVLMMFNQRLVCPLNPKAINLCFHHDSKSKKGLAEVYEEEYVQKSNPLFAPSTFSDELKKEVPFLKLVFKHAIQELCLKLDALSHFHFTPKPVIEEMSIQTNVPAIAMEEVAPLAVSDAAMLAPEEMFSGTGKIKEDSELTQEERKRRRAKKKRKFKAESAKQPVKKARDTTSTEMSKTGIFSYSNMT
ncbi:BnaC07g16690D [Brassica napus]|uniref:BnaC07g16690D protein n=1 Tax=Brassica napus TaxID=3708 RepID=A0A078GZZ2_BRANA|nr:BnaC07g16690D [Brassica napus]